MKTIEELRTLIDRAQPHIGEQAGGAVLRLANVQLELMRELVERIALVDGLLARRPIGDEPRVDGLTIDEWRDAARAAEKKLAEGSR